MLIIKDISHLKLYLKAYRDKGHSIGYVPTMGSLHQGHAKLIKQSRDHNQKTVISTFVNEKQFNKKEDFDNYPRNKGKDYDFCDLHNVDVIFEPPSSHCSFLCTKLSTPPFSIWNWRLFFAAQRTQLS